MSSEPTSTYRIPSEQAPSEVLQEEHWFIRSLGTAGATLLTAGIIVVLANESKPRFIPTQVGAGAILLGFLMTIFHALRDGEQTIRRSYGYGGIALWLKGLLWALIPLYQSATKTIPEGQIRVYESYFFPYGISFLTIGLFYIAAWLKHETQSRQRKIGLYLLGISAIAAISIGFFVGSVETRFVSNYSTTLLLYGLACTCVLIVNTGGVEGDGFYLAWTLIGVGGVMFLTVLIRVFLPKDIPFFVPTGILLLILSALYMIVGYFWVSDSQYATLTRRELASYFTSPIGYGLMVISLFFGGLSYLLNFEPQIFTGGQRRVIFEPIVAYFCSSEMGILAVTMIVPIITMRLISEEKRTGTYEVLMVAPVSDWAVILSKFTAAWFMYLFTWLLWGAYLLYFRADNPAFEIRPLLSFGLTVALAGLNFIGMGLFFSSLTKNQIIAAALTLLGMMFYLGLYIVGATPLIFPVSETGLETSPWKTFFLHASYINMWFQSGQGRLQVRDVVLHASLSIGFLFATQKVLEARRWS